MSSILFVSHDGDLRAVAGRVLRQQGWDVTAAAHGGHALLACARGATFDVLVVDGELPEGTGAGLARRLRRFCPEIQVIEMRDRPAHGAEAGIAVLRPFTADTLVEAVLQAAAAAVATV